MDTISDMLTRIRNGLMANKKEVEVLFSKQNLGILKVLKEQGYINDYNEVDIRKGVKRINVALKYFKNQAVINTIKRVSKPSRRVFVANEEIPLVYNGLGISIISTSKGILSDNEARIHKVGGEIICSVF